MSSSGTSARRSAGVSGRDDYFSIDDILASQERVLCTFDKQIAKMGYLDPSAETEHIMPGARVELPCWLACALASGNWRRRTASAELPRQYREVYREILDAEAAVVDLHRIGPYYYAFGCQLVTHFENAENADMARALQKAFQSRLRRIMDGSQNALEADSLALMETLDESERRIFERGAAGLSAYLRWESRQSERLGASTMVANLRKRKRAQMNDANTSAS